MADFTSAFFKTLTHEGVRFDDERNPLPESTGYNNDPDDSGGETNYGITRQLAMENGYNGSMEDIPFAKVKEIYRWYFWEHLRCGEIQNQAIAEELFDTAVNCGRQTAGQFLQIALNVMNKQEALYPDIEEDGGVGPITLRTLAAALAAGPRYAKCIFRLMDGYQTYYYSALCKKKPRKEKFMAGWVWNRCA